MRNNIKAKKQSGFTLLEITMVAGIIIVLSVLTIVGFRMASDSTKMNSAVNNLNSLTSGIRSMFATQGNYEDLSNSVLLTSNSIPEDMRIPNDTTKIKSPWDYIDVASANVSGTDDDGFQITFKKVPSRSCQELATRVFRTYTVTAGSTQITSVAKAAAACGGGSSTGTIDMKFATR